MTYFWTVYSLGLRLEEALNLHVGDIDAERMMVHIHRGKGAKDRYLPLPSATLLLLRANWRNHRNPTLLFPADGRNHKGQSKATKPHRSARCYEENHGATKLWQENLDAHVKTLLRHALARSRFVVARDPETAGPFESNDHDGLFASD